MNNKGGLQQSSSTNTLITEQSKMRYDMWDFRKKRRQ